MVSVPSTLDEDVLSLDVTQLPHSLEESLPGAPASGAVRRGTPEKAQPMDFRGLLGLGGERRGDDGDRSKEKRAPARHGITSSARASTDDGIVRPRAFAVFRFMTSVWLVDCSTGKSAGEAPLRILSTKAPTRGKRLPSCGNHAIRSPAAADLASPPDAG